MHRAKDAQLDSHSQSWDQSKRKRRCETGFCLEALYFIWVVLPSFVEKHEELLSRPGNQKPKKWTTSIGACKNASLDFGNKEREARWGSPHFSRSSFPVLSGDTAFQKASNTPRTG